MNTNNDDTFLVQGRECGDCDVCCKVLTIDTPELKKTPNHTCHNLNIGVGCSLYPKWPSVCQKWYCAWRNLSDLDDSWRPDRINILTEFARENFPPPFTNRVGFRFTVIDRHKLAKNRKLAKFIMKQIKNGTPCLLAFGAEENTEQAAAFLNIALAKVVKSNNINAVLRELVKALEACDQRPKITYEVKNGELEKVII